MTTRRPHLGMLLSSFPLGMAVLLVFLWVLPSEAFFDFKSLWSFGKEKAVVARPKDRVEGHLAKVFIVKKAKADDLVEPLRNYMKGNHSQGDLVANAADNTLIATDSPDNLLRLEAIVREMDRPYDHPNAMARRMLVAQSLVGAIRTLTARGALTAPGTGSGGAMRPVSTLEAGQISMTAPLGVPPQTISPPAAVSGLPVAEEGRQWRVLEEKLSLRAFHMVGWMRDDNGFLVVLRNEGQRFIFRRGKLHYWSLANVDSVQGISGVVRGQELVLSDPRQGQISLKMTRPHGSTDVTP